MAKFEVSDVFIQNTSGIPYVARCFGGDYCRMNQDHSLITGFFAALNSFKSEFNQESLQIVGFNDLTLVLEQFGEVLVIIGIDNFDKHTDVRTVAKQVLDEFRKRYADEIEGNLYAKMSNLNDFIDWLDGQIGDAMGDLMPLVEGKKKSFLDRVRKKFKL